MDQEEEKSKNSLGTHDIDHCRPEADASTVLRLETPSSEQDSIGYLKENLEVLETLFSNTHFLIAFLDTEFNFIRVNRAYAEYNGQSPEYFFGINHFDLFPHQENEGIFRRVVQSGQAYTAFERPFNHPLQPDEEPTYWDWSLQPVRGSDNDIIGLILSLVDVTRRKRAEEEVKLRGIRYRDLLEQSLDGFIRMDMKGHIIESNPAFGDMVGYTEDELKSLSSKDLTPIGWLKREEKIFNSLFQSGYTPIYEKEYISKEGNAVPVELRSYLTRDEKGKPTEMWAFVRDITEKKEREDELKDYVARLEQSNRGLAEFAYVASHDLQEPLRKIQTFGDRLSMKHAGSLSETGRDYLERMIKASRRMRELIESLLSYYRISFREEHFARVDLNVALDEALSNLETRIEETGAELEIMELPALEADPVQMVQLLQNLLGNALKFRRKDTPPIVKIGYRLQSTKKKQRRKKAPGPDFYEIFIQDNGIGFEKKYENLVFVPLQRLHGRSEYDGVGMGLAICRRIIEMHGGSIKVESQPGQGTTFLINLPVSREAK